MQSPLYALHQAGDPTHPPLLLLHGRGSDEQDLLPLGRELHPSLPIHSVRAPFEAAPWGYGPGYAWYRYLHGSTPEATSFEAGQDALTAFVNSRAGAERGYVIGGFSQGGTSALAHALRHPDRVLGVLVFSGFLADHPSITLRPEQVGTTPIFWGHGTADPAIPHAIALAGQQRLAAAGANLTVRHYEGMPHRIAMDELQDAAAWLAGVLPGA